MGGVLILHRKQIIKLLAWHISACIKTEFWLNTGVRFFCSFFNIFNELLLPWTYNNLKPTFCHSGTGNRDSTQRLQENGIHYQNFGGLEWESRGMKQLHALAPLFATWSRPCLCWVNAHAPLFSLSRWIPLLTENNLRTASPFTVPFCLSWCPLLHVLQLSLPTISVSP